MSKKRRAPMWLQVLFDPDEYREILETAARQGMTVAELVRTALREVRRRERRKHVRRKLEAIRRAAAFSFPAPDIPQMLVEIERGYLAGSSP